MNRRDWWRDDDAPAANSIVPSVTVATRNDSGQLLLIHKIDNGLWALPGGAVDLGESVASAGIRETLEETGVRVMITGLVGLYTDPDHVIGYADGEVRQEFSICFHARPRGGDSRGRADGTETKAVRWIDHDQLDRLDIHPAMRLRISHAMESRPSPYLGTPADLGGGSSA